MLIICIYIEILSTATHMHMMQYTKWNILKDRAYKKAISICYKFYLGEASQELPACNRASHLLQW